MVEEEAEIERNTSACSKHSDKAPSINEEEQKGGILLDLEDMASKADKLKIKELVSTEISLEKQLEGVQRQLLALKQLPSEIENHLKIVSDQLQKIMELSGVDSRRGSTGKTIIIIIRYVIMKVMYQLSQMITADKRIRKERMRTMMLRRNMKRRQRIEKKYR